MEMDWRAGLAMALGAIVLFLVLIRSAGARQTKIQRLEADLRQTERELLRFRGEHAKEVAELKEEHAKVIATLQGNIKDLTAVHQEKNRSDWSGWTQNQNRSALPTSGNPIPGS